MSEMQPFPTPPPATLSDEEVVREILSGKPQLFEILMRRNNQRIYRAVRAILRNEAEAEDVMQQAYINAFTHLAQFGERARFSTWMTRIAIHEALAKLRRGSRDPLQAPLESESEDAMPPVESPYPDPEARAMASDVRRLLEEAIDSLAEHYRTVLMLREVEGLSTGETAACLGVTEDVIKTRLHRARGLVRDHLFERGGLTFEQLFSFEAPRCDRIVAGVFEAIRRMDEEPAN